MSSWALKSYNEVDIVHSLVQKACLSRYLSLRQLRHFIPANLSQKYIDRTKCKELGTKNACIFTSIQHYTKESMSLFLNKLILVLTNAMTKNLRSEICQLL